MNPWTLAQRTPELWHNPWAQKPADPNWWLISQWVHDQSSDQMVKKEGKTAAELFGLDPSWPGDD